MANCKFCGEPVTAGPVCHQACWDRRMEEAAQVFCDEFCRWPWLCRTEEELDEEHCSRDCPINRLTMGG